ncbi:MAG: multiple antibiotic resistance protein [Roseivirga sp.]|jgi:multiple antibiotic resistance protein
MNFSFKEIISATMILFAVIDIMGSIPLIISLRQKVGHIQSEKASIVAAVIMIVFLFLGESILKYLGVDINSFAVAGALILFILALEMVLGVNLIKDEEPKSASIVPLAFPLIAGAGSMTTIVSLRAEFDAQNIVVAILINCVLVYTVLKGAAWLEKILGESGLNILRKVFGVILLAISVKLFSENAVQLFT